MLCRLLIVFFLSSVSGFAQEQPVAKQQSIGPMACGPCAVVNSLTVANNPVVEKLPGKTQLEQVQSFIEKFKELDSTIYGKHRKIYSEDNGSSDRDLRHMLNEFFAEHGIESTDGSYVVRDNSTSESQPDFVARIHGQLRQSIENGFHPIVSIRAMAAEFNKQRDRHLWNSKGGHFIAIHEVGTLREGSLSFPVVLSDSWAGKMFTAMVYLDPTRNTSIPTRFTVDEEGNEVWEWEKGSDTLAILCPEMPLGTRRAMWYERTVIAVRYVITK